MPPVRAKVGSEIRLTGNRMDSDQLNTALKSVTCERFAELLTLVIGLASENHPDELKAALGKVFDTQAIEETNKRAIILLTNTLTKESDAQLKAGELVALLAVLENRIDKAEAYLDRLDKRIKPVSNGRKP
jgi:CII-binding regulator of phage lambda lysogenization HflD